MVNKSGLVYEKNFWRCALLSFLLGCLCFGYYVFKDNGLFLIKSDFNTQQIPFGMALNSLLKSHQGVEWSWNIGLGTQTIGAYSFYGLGSPFYWISLLGEASSYPYIISILYVLKYTIAGMTSYMYLRLFLKDSRCILWGGLLYAFSGFQSTNLLFHFHDAVALFPLLIFGLENTIRTKKKSFFILAVFFNCLVNYFLFVGEVVFLGIYFGIRFFDKFKIKLLIKKAVGLIFCGMVGIGMAAVVFFPSILFIMGNSRSQFSLGSLYGGLGFRPLLHILKGFLLPGETMGSQSALLTLNFDSTGAYLPMVGLAFVICYIVKNRDWLSRLLIVLFVFAFMPFLSSTFTLFTVNYQRWWYMLVLVMSLASARVLEEKEQYNIRAGICINIILILLLCVAIVGIGNFVFKSDWIFRKDVYAYEIIVSVTGLLVLDVSLKRKKFHKWIILCTSFFCFLTTFVTIHLYQNDTEALAADEYRQKLNLGMKLENYSDQYRYRLSDNILILSGKAIGTGIFSSTISNSIREFEELFDYTSKNFNLDLGEVVGLNELMAAKYEIKSVAQNDDLIVDSLDIDGQIYYIVEHAACPIGFAYDSYLFYDELMEMNVSCRGVALLDNLCIDEAEESAVIEYLIHSNKKTNEYTEEAIENLTKKNIDSGVKDFQRNNSGFHCTVAYDQNKAVFFSVPYDNGWVAFIDGKEVEILKTVGMMSLMIPFGQHDICFRYRTPGLWQGAAVSVISLLVLAMIILAENIGWGKGVWRK